MRKQWDCRKEMKVMDVNITFLFARIFPTDIECQEQVDEANRDQKRWAKIKYYIHPSQNFHMKILKSYNPQLQTAYKVMSIVSKKSLIHLYVLPSP